MKILVRAEEIQCTYIMYVWVCVFCNYPLYQFAITNHVSVVGLCH